jgi:hypothetical protein
VELAAVELLAADPERARQRPGQGRWSAQEILGHLIDSAANNHARFVLAPGRSDLLFDGYDQEEWVRVQSYDTADWPTLVALWRAYNLHLAHVMRVIPAEARTAPRATHSLDRIAFRPVPPGEPATLEYLMEDYVVHLRHHLEQIRALLGSG